MVGQPARSAQIARWVDEQLVGRDEIVDEMVAIADDAARGLGSIVILSGEAGIGKTSVARVVARHVHERMGVSWGACTADRSTPPFWPWHSLVTLEHANRLATDPTVGAPRFEQLRALREQVCERVVGAPHLHVIEDVQWADVASVLLLGHVGVAIGATPLLVIATMRTEEPLPHPLDTAIEDVRRASTVRQLAPLRHEDIATLARRAGTVAEDHLIDLLASRTGGNPLFVTELLRAVATTGAPDRRLATLAESVPDRVTDLIVSRLERLPGVVSDMLLTAAVLGAEGTTSSLAAVHGADAGAIGELLDQGRAAHLLDPAPPGRWRFRHELVRDAVYRSASSVERARRHASVVEAIAADPASPPPMIAHHALAARPLFDADRAVALAARAGEWSFAQHAYEEAVTWFERALDEAPLATSPRWRSELLVLCGEAHRHIGSIGDARRALLRAAGLTDEPSLLARAALGYADPGADLGIAYRSDDDVTTALLERAIGAQPTLDSLTGVQLEARLAAELYFSDHPDRAVTLAGSALRRAHALDDPLALGIASAVVHDAYEVGRTDLAGLLDQSAQLIEWAERSGSVSARLTAHRARVFDLLAAGDIAGMDAEVLAFRRLAEPLRVPGYLWWPALWSAMHALLEGRHDEAESRALQAYEIGQGPFPTLSFFNLSFLLFFLRREQGRLSEMEQPTRDHAASHADVPAIRVALTFLLAEVGRVEEVRATLAAFDDAALDKLHDRNWPASWFQLARAAFVAGDRRLATALLASDRQPRERCVQVSLATVCLGATDLARAWLLHTTGDLDAADAAYRAAADLNARLGARSWLAQTHADHARLLLDRDATGDRAEADRLGDLADAAARAIGLATVATASRPHLAIGPTFRRAGSVWELSFLDRTVQLPEARGLRDLAHLLGHPGEAVSALELAGDTGRSIARGAPALDERARREIRERLRQLDADEADAEASGDGERAALAREQRQSLAEAVARDVGLGGRSRRIDDPVERARKTVSTRIHRAITAIERVHPELGRHLARSIDTGSWCAYRPAEPIDWRT